MTLASHCGYLTSLINPASNRHWTSAFATFIFSSDIFQSFYFLGFTFGLTCSLCLITSLLTPIKSEVDQAKTSLFLSRNCRGSASSSGLISAPIHTILSDSGVQWHFGELSFSFNCFLEFGWNLVLGRGLLMLCVFPQEMHVHVL
jgi:hypothetical protein